MVVVIRQTIKLVVNFIFWLLPSLNTWEKIERNLLIRPSTRVCSVLKKSIIVLVCYFGAGVSLADWVRVTESMDADYYFSPGKVFVRGDVRKIWELQNLKKVTIRGERSFRYLSEYHCIKNQWRILHYTGHSESMGAGRILSAKTDKEWYVIPPGTPRIRLLDQVCKL